jgi:hypothetical protein
MKSLVVLVLIGLGGCTSHNKPLAMVQDDDPVFILNPDRTTSAVNDLITPTEPGLPKPLTPAQRITTP